MTERREKIYSFKSVDARMNMIHPAHLYQYRDIPVKKILMFPAAAMAILASVQSRAATYDFSFTDSFNNMETVTGQIVLPDGDSTGEVATSVTITSAPAAILPANDLPYNVVVNTALLSSDNFIVTNGEISYADFFTYFGQADQESLYLGTSGGGYLESRSGTDVHSDSGIIFTPVTTTPLPGSVALFGSALAGLAAFGFARRRKVGSVPDMA